MNDAIMAKRITADEVVNAYKKHNLKLGTKRLIEDDRYCGLGAICFDKEISLEKDWDGVRRVAYERLNSLYGNRYIIGFYRGFDGIDFICKGEELGHADGKAAYEACVKEGLCV